MIPFGSFHLSAIMSTFAKSQRWCELVEEEGMASAAQSSTDPPNVEACRDAGPNRSTMVIVADHYYDEASSIRGYAFSVDEKVMYCGRAEDYVEPNGEKHEVALNNKNDVMVTCMLKICEMLYQYNRIQHVELYILKDMNPVAMWFDQKHCQKNRFHNIRFPVLDVFIEHFFKNHTSFSVLHLETNRVKAPMVKYWATMASRNPNAQDCLGHINDVVGQCLQEVAGVLLESVMTVKSDMPMADYGMLWCDIQKQFALGVSEYERTWENYGQMCGPNGTPLEYNHDRQYLPDARSRKPWYNDLNHHGLARVWAHASRG